MSTTLCISMVDHARKRIAETKLQTEPWSYMFIENIFSEADYRKMLDLLPPKTSFWEYHEGNTSNLEFYASEFHRATEREKFRALTQEQKDFWLEFSQIVEPELHSALWSKLEGPIQKHIDALFEMGLLRGAISTDRLFQKFVNVPRGNLFWRTKFGIGPHLHTLAELLTCIIYLPRDRSMVKYGTDLYRITKSEKIHETDLTNNPHIRSDIVERIVTTEFLPNSALVMLSSPITVHGNTAPDGERVFFYSRSFLNKWFFYEEYVPANTHRPNRLKRRIFPKKVDLLDYQKACF